MNVGQQFMPHGMCYLWNPQMLLLQIVSDAGIAIAYFSIPVMLLYFLRTRGDIPLRGTIAMFGVFIVACGLTHVMGIWTIWHPAFWLDGSLKAFTAGVSLFTAAMLVPLIPRALTLKTPTQLELLNAELQQDVRARREALDESERQNRALAEAMPQIVFIADVDGSVTYYNQSWFDYTGMTFEQTQGWGWEPVLHPDDLQRCLDAWTYSLASGTSYEIEYRFLRASDSTYRWHIGRALPVRVASGAITKWFGTVTDIDDLRAASEAAGRFAESLRLNELLERDIRAREHAEAALLASEELFRQVEEHAPIGLALVALDGGFIRVNPALCRLTKLSEAELLSTSFQALTHPEDLNADIDLVDNAIAGAMSSYELEQRYVLHDGEIAWIQLNCSLVRDDRDRPSYFIRQIQDITERKAAAEIVETAQRAALAASSAKSRFLATMSHEIRTPMNGIIGMTELLSLSQLSAEQSEYVKVVRDSGRSLLRVLNDILDYSKIEAGKLDLEVVDFDVLAQIRSVISLLGPQFSVKNISLATQVEPDVPSALKGDPGRIRQILINLVGNALKFTPAEGSIRILVAAGPRSGETIPVRFTIVDTGAGIAREARGRLFQPFSQIDESTTRRYGGTGLGLSICKQLIDVMGGEIGVESTVGSGSSFWFTVPFRIAATAERTLKAPAREMGDRRAPAKRRPERILVAEDNEVNTLLAIKQFELLGFAVTVVSNGREALAAVRNEQFDAVFMDCHMPEMDGLDATRQIRKLPSDVAKRIPIIAMTADAQAEDELACLSAGMDDYISKPASVADLQAAITRWIPSVSGG